MMILSVMAILPVLIASVEAEQQGFTVMNQSDLSLKTVIHVSLQKGRNETCVD